MERRRSSDSSNLDIDEMIGKENDPEKRATLMVLQSINQSLLANTMAIEDMHGRLTDHIGEFRVHRGEFQEHAKIEGVILNQAKGGWKVMSWVLGVAQVAMIAGFSWYGGQLNDLQTGVHALEVTVSTNSSRLKTLERHSVFKGAE